MKTHFLFCLVATSALLLCCNCVSCKKHCKSIPKSTIDKALKIQVDDSVKHLYGDSIAQIVFEADSIQLVRLSVSAPIDSTQNQSAETDSVAAPNFHGCYIAQDFGNLSKSEIAPLSLILSDRATYFPDDIRVKSPFMPDVALIFKKEDSKIDMVFSFSGGQMYVFTATEDKKYFKYDYERLVLVFFQQYLKDENIAKYLNL